VFALAVRSLVGVEPWASIVGVVLALALAGLLRGRIRLLMDDRPIGAARRLLERLYFAHWGAAVVSPGTFAVALVPVLFGVTSIGGAAVAGYGVALVAALYGVFIRTRVAKMRTIEIPIEGLPPAFDGYRIVQLSDVHIGSLFPRAAARRFVLAANALEPDLVALTGDYVTSGNAFHEDVALLFGELRARDGVALVWGNHDNYGEREPLRSLLVTQQVRVLENGVTRVERGGASLSFVGVDDIFSRRADVARAFEPVAPDEVVIGLVHDPKLYPAIAERGAKLVLTGHTHWGQIGVPLAARRLNLAKRFFRYPGGLYRTGSTTLYVHPGIGSTGPPIRFGVPPEITLFVLRVAAQPPENAPRARNFA